MQSSGTKNKLYTGNGGVNHNKTHLLDFDKISLILRELRQCVDNKSEKVKRGQLTITYHVYLNSDRREFTILGFYTTKCKTRFAGFVLAAAGAGKKYKIITYYEFKNKSPNYLTNRIYKYECFKALEPSDYPYIHIREADLGRVAH